MTSDSRSSSQQELRDWEFSVVGRGDWSRVSLPHDAMVHEKRTSSAAGGADVGYFPGGRYIYRTAWFAPQEPSAVAALFFEGVQGDADVIVNGFPCGSIRGGYTESIIPFQNQVRWGAVNEIVVNVDNSAQPSSRWYPGSGLYRPVSITLQPEIRFAPDGLRVRTTDISTPAASVDIEFTVLNGDEQDLSIAVELLDKDVVVASAIGKPANGTVQMNVSNPRAWSAEEPHLYELTARILQDGRTLDARRELLGLRTIDLDARHGLRINGRTVLLRGACIHHDNGVLGAATHRAAEFRRISLLKKAGFNAIRSAHNPMSRHLLDACDRIGMYVLDELADYWFVSKTAHDHAGRFCSTWREDADQMVAKDRNRACVIMYASGNEIPETATAEGVALAQDITDYLHTTDPTRPVTVAINLFLNTLVSMDKSPYKAPSPGDPTETTMAGSTEANVMINQIGRMMDIVSRLPRADKASKEAFAVVDVAGYNYGLGRYGRDVRAYPDRVILGSETLPGDVAKAWHAVQKHDAVIGDFIWAGWEYLGEAGVSVWVPGKRAGLSKPYPYILSGPGMFDLIGNPDITLRLAQAAWGTLSRPAIGVRPVNLSGTPMVRSAWRKTDAVESWSWRGCEGRTAEVQVYSEADRIELRLNGRRIGNRKAGRRHGYLAKFAVPYEPGTLTAIAYDQGREVSRSSLTSAQGPLTLTLTADKSTISADGRDLLFAEIAISDSQGVVEMLADEQVQVEVSGPGELIGFGSAAPATEESYVTNFHTSFRGRALAVIRSTGAPGTIAITAQTHTKGPATLTITAIPALDAGPVPTPLLDDAVTAAVD